VSFPPINKEFNTIDVVPQDKKKNKNAITPRTALQKSRPSS